VRLNLGPELLQHLLPQQPPFRMIDRVLALNDKPREGLHARKLIGSNEPVLQGHFPTLPLWPGVYTIEALAQATNLLMVLLGLRRTWAELGRDDAELFKHLDLAGRALRMEAPAGPEAEELKRLLGPGPGVSGLLSAVDVKLSRPVWAGQVLDLHVDLDEGYAGLFRVEVEAQVERRTVAKGSLAVARTPG
jgi:3-hydroxymyristoyl/3-hydroxydecanoyl-(acyl carrier protein) dehydratase